MRIHEKQAVYWRLPRQETEEDYVETKLTIADFILVPFDKECLSEEPPESDWSWMILPIGWRSKHPKKISLQTQTITHLLTILTQRRLMKNQMTPLNIPVPPAPILEQAVGYHNNRNARYLALWWEPAGDEAMVSDGYITFTGHWPGYLAYIHHPSVYSYLVTYNLGSSDDLAEYRLIIDLQERQAFVCRSQEAVNLLASQWESSTQKLGGVSLSSKDLEALLNEFVHQVLTPPTLDELERRMDADRRAVETLTRWLNAQVKELKP